MAKIDLSIVIPAYNEEKRIEHSLDSLEKYIKTDKYLNSKNIEVIVVSPDSQDKTHQIIKKKQLVYKNLKFIKSGKRIGKGKDVKTGVLESSGEYIIYMDADLATPLSHISQFYKAAKEND